MKSHFANIKPANHYNIMQRSMKTNPYLSASLRTVVLLAFLLSAALGWAADGNPPERMTYQGYLTDANGEPLGNTSAGPKNYDVTFRIYPDATSATKLWAEQQTVTVDKGYFSVLLGEGTIVPEEPRPVLNTLFTGATASDRYIEVTVQGIGPSGGPVTIAPRLRLLTSPYSFLARNAVSAANLVNSGNSQIVSISGTSVGINKASPATALDVAGTVTATGLTISGTATITNINGPTVFNHDVGITSGHVLELGKNATKQVTAGVIGYQKSSEGLDIFGAGSGNMYTRKVKIWAEGGVTVTGSVTNNGTVSATAFVGNGVIPIGGIIMWSGSISSIPTGWALCNGLNGTPNLTNRFVLAASLTVAPGSTGGAATHTLTAAEMPSHSHNVNHWTYSIRRATNPDGTYNIDQVTNAPSLSTKWTTETNGSGTAFSTMPPYYALAYIIRVQ
jgi:microcystin-dependent protein